MRRFALGCFAAFLFLLISGCAFGHHKKWTDEEGVVHIKGAIFGLGSISGDKVECVSPIQIGDVGKYK